MATTNNKKKNAASRSKEICRHLMAYYPVDTTDVLDPSGDRTSDILWNIACHVYGEDYLLESMRGQDNKLICLAVVMRRLLDDCKLPASFQPPFGLLDMISPNSSRVMLIYSAIINYLEFFNAQAHIRDKVVSERSELLAKEEQIKVDISKTLETIKQTKGDNKGKKKLMDQLQAENSGLVARKTKLQTQSENLQAEIKHDKSTISTTQGNLASVKSQIKTDEKDIQFYKENIFPPPEVFEEKQQQLRADIKHVQDHISTREERFGEVSRKFEDAQHLRSFYTRLDQLCEGVTACLDEESTIESQMIKLEKQSHKLDMLCNDSGNKTECAAGRLLLQKIRHYVSEYREVSKSTNDKLSDINAAMQCILEI